MYYLCTRNGQDHTHGLTAFPAGAGASGAVFGIAGALIILLKSHRLPVPPLELHKLRRSVIYFAAINLVIGFTISLGVVVRHTGVSIDNLAHLGGFIAACSSRPRWCPGLARPAICFSSAAAPPP